MLLCVRVLLFMCVCVRVCRGLLGLSSASASPRKSYMPLFQLKHVHYMLTFAPLTQRCFRKFTCTDVGIPKAISKHQCDLEAHFTTLAATLQKVINKIKGEEIREGARVRARVCMRVGSSASKYTSHRMRSRHQLVLCSTRIVPSPLTPPFAHTFLHSLTLCCAAATS